MENGAFFLPFPGALLQRCYRYRTHKKQKTL